MLTSISTSFSSNISLPSSGILYIPPGEWSWSYILPCIYYLLNTPMHITPKLWRMNELCKVCPIKSISSSSYQQIICKYLHPSYGGDTHCCVMVLLSYVDVSSLKFTHPMVGIASSCQTLALDSFLSSRVNHTSAIIRTLEVSYLTPIIFHVCAPERVHSVYIVGNDQLLGTWDKDMRVALQRGTDFSGIVDWSSPSFFFTNMKAVQYKFLHQTKEELCWECATSDSNNLVDFHWPHQFRLSLKCYLASCNHVSVFRCYFKLCCNAFVSSASKDFTQLQALLSQLEPSKEILPLHHSPQIHEDFLAVIVFGYIVSNDQYLSQPSFLWPNPDLSFKAIGESLSNGVSLPGFILNCLECAIKRLVTLPISNPRSWMNLLSIHQIPLTWLDFIKPCTEQKFLDKEYADLVNFVIELIQKRPISKEAHLKVIFNSLATSAPTVQQYLNCFQKASMYIPEFHCSPCTKYWSKQSRVAMFTYCKSENMTRLQNFQEELANIVKSEVLNATVESDLLPFFDLPNLFGDNSFPTLLKELVTKFSLTGCNWTLFPPIINSLKQQGASHELIKGTCSAWLHSAPTNQVLWKSASLLFSKLSDGPLQSTLYNSVIEKSLTLPDFLETACDVSTSNNMELYFNGFKDFIKPYFSATPSLPQLDAIIAKLCHCQPAIYSEYTVSNSLIDTCMCHLLELLPTINPEHTSDNLAVTVMKGGPFWWRIIMLTESCPITHANIKVQTVRNTLSQLARALSERTMPIQEFQSLTAIESLTIAQFITPFTVNKTEASRIVEVAMNDFNQFSKNFESISVFLRQFCVPTFASEELSSFAQVLKEGKNTQGAPLRIQEAGSLEFWNPFLLPLSHLKLVLPVYNMTSFQSFWQSEVKHTTPSTVDEVLTAMNSALTCFNSFWRNLAQSKPLTFEVACEVFGSIDPQSLSSEIFQAERLFAPFTPQTKQALESVLSLATHRRNTAFLLRAMIICELSQHCSKLQVTVDALEPAKIDASLITDVAIKTKQLTSLISAVTTASWPFIEMLTDSTLLITFLKEKRSEDLRQLVGAFEDYSDEMLQEGCVADLVDLKRLISPLVDNVKPLCSLEEFINVVNRVSSECPSIAGKLRSCNENFYALQHAFDSLANRGEVTREIVQNTISQGTFRFFFKDSQCEVVLTFREKPGMKTLNDLLDLRSRALLFTSTDYQRVKPTVRLSGTTSQIELNSMQQFILVVDIIQDIVSSLNIIFDLGVCGSKYACEHTNVHTLQEMNRDLDNSLDEVVNALDESRKHHYVLNFFLSNQIWTLYNLLLSGHISSEVQELICLLPSEVTLKCAAVLPPIQFNLECLNALGENLSVFLTHKRCKVPLVFNETRDQFTDCQVTMGKIFVAIIGDKSELNVVMALYTNHGFMPERHELIFCTSETKQEEIEIFLNRCLGATKAGFPDSLYCCVHPELLSTESQQHISKTVMQAQEAHNQFRLALVCQRKNGKQWIGNAFNSISQHIAGMPTPQLHTLLTNMFPSVTIVSSTSAGLGKTEMIFQKCFEMGKGVCTVDISGPVERGSILSSLRSAKLSKFEALHLNIGMVNDPELLSTILFELIVLGSISSGAKRVYHIPSERMIFIEIANTAESQLINQFYLGSLFKEERLTWSLDNLIVNHNIKHPIQVVCNYLDSQDKHLIDTQEISFGEDLNASNALVIPDARCKVLLNQFFLSRIDWPPSFFLLFTFLRIFSDQLRKMSLSQFFRVENLQAMGADPNTRSLLVDVLCQVASKFATSGIGNLQQQEVKRSLSHVPEERLVQLFNSHTQSWENLDFFMVIFHSVDAQSITALYKTNMPKTFEKLLTTQSPSKTLEDYRALSEPQLIEKLKRISRVDNSPCQSVLQGYSITPDNLLKMAMVITRVHCHVPVILMGDTGCGKTSLIRFLKSVLDLPVFETLNCHAGTSLEEIINFIRDVTQKCNKLTAQTGSTQDCWAFFDEINTSEHIGVLSEVVVHHRLLGSPLPSNITFLAACNPYRLCGISEVTAGGLLSTKVQVTPNQTRLVYSVLPLPESMLEYVFDYGCLSEEDEKAYISCMLSQSVPDMPQFPSEYVSTVSKLLSRSQSFLRKVHTPWSVSLRDIRRFIRLFHWFMASFSRPLREKRIGLSNWQQQTSRRHKPELQVHPSVKAIILALSHCYHSALETPILRQQFRKLACHVLHSCGYNKGYGEQEYLKILRKEQKDYLKRMELPPGTALNEALLENVFVLLVCILNKIPIFLVGKPGCSKSLSMQLINRNLRGADSRDKWFQKCDQVISISFQGSESATSEGIKKVFTKAKQFVKKGVLPVVILDEVGLAEISRHNPLKVLHSLLEPGFPKEIPEVAVIGISNWALDAAKMNRALHLTRPDPEPADLLNTAKEILKGLCPNTPIEKPIENWLKGLSEAYYEHVKKQSPANFHGLRDFYSLIKCISRTLKGNASDMEVYDHLNGAIQRNFGGIPRTLEGICQGFLSKTMTSKQHHFRKIAVMELIRQNIHDPCARHLLIITRGESAINMILQSVCSPTFLYGSKFPHDQCADYYYRILSRIILAMENGEHLILKGLEPIYGSLYDLLNQSYTVVGERKNCRIALGAHSNPMCFVHDSFRCIVLTEEQTLPFSDPPFLNRFEKQVLTYEEVLTEVQKRHLQELITWSKEISKLPQHPEFSVEDLFLGWNRDVLCSLILSIHGEDQAILDTLKSSLTQLATASGVMRTVKSQGASHFSSLKDLYFKKQSHINLKSALEWHIQNSPKGCKLEVLTFSPINCDIALELNGLMTFHLETLGIFKSERELRQKIQVFFESEANLLVIQCNASEPMDVDNMHLLRLAIDQSHATQQSTPKHVCVVVYLNQHEHRADSSKWLFDYLSGWTVSTVESLNLPFPGLMVEKLLSKPLDELLDNQQFGIDLILERAFMNILYPSDIQYSSRITNMVSLIKTSSLLNFLQSKTKEILQQSSQCPQWQITIACSKTKLLRHGSLILALIDFFTAEAISALSRVLFALENVGALYPYLLSGNEETGQMIKVLCDYMFSTEALNIPGVPIPQPGILLQGLGTNFNTSFPFFNIIMTKIESFRDVVLTSYEVSKDKAIEDLASIVQEVLPPAVNTILCKGTSATLLYLRDFFSIKHVGSALSFQQQIQILEANIEKSAGDMPPFEVHFWWWLKGDAIRSQIQLASCLTKILPIDKMLELVNCNYTGAEFVSGLISRASKLLIPGSESDLLITGGIESWSALASKVREYSLTSIRRWAITTPVELSILHLLNDFSLIIPYGVPISQFLELCLLTDSEDFFTSDTLFNKIIQAVVSIKQVNCVEVCLLLQSFLGNLHFQKLEIAFDHSLPSVLSNIHSSLSTVGPSSLLSLCHCSVLLDEIIEHSKETDSTIFATVCATTPAALVEVEKVFHPVPPDLESNIQAVLCSILESNYLEEIPNLAQEEAASWIKVAFLPAMDVLSSEVVSIRTCFAVALMRALLRLFAIGIKTGQMPCSAVFDLFAAFFEQQEHPRSIASKTFFLKLLHQQGMGITEIEEFCKQSTVPSWLQTVHWAPRHYRLIYNPFDLLVTASEGEQLIAEVVKDRRTLFLHEFMSSATTNEKAQSLLCAFSGSIFLTYSQRPLHQGEEYLISWVETACPSQFPHKRLLLEILKNREPFSLKPVSSLHDIHISVILVFLDILIATSNLKLTPFGSYRQGVFADQFVLAGFSAPPSTDSLHSVKHYRCQCGTNFILGCAGKVIESTICPSCSTLIMSADQGTNYPLEQITQLVPSVTGYIKEEVNASWNWTQRELSPPAYRLLHLIVSSTFLLSESSIQPKSLFRSHINNDWQILMHLLGCTEDVMLLVVIQSLLQITKLSFQRHQLCTESDRSKWEIEWQKFVDSHICNNLNSFTVDGLKMLLAKSSPVEREITEVDKPDPRSLPRLYRITLLGSYELLKARVVCLPHSRSDFPFLHLLFNSFQKLEYISHLQVLCNWVATVKKYFGHLVKRSDAKNAVSHIIRGVPHLKELFPQFSLSWNTIKKSLPEIQYQSQKFAQEQIPSMSEMQSFELCCIDEKDQGIFLAGMLSTIAQYQNQFLEESFKIALRGCKSVKMLQQEGGLRLLHEIHIQNAQQPHFISVSSEIWETVLPFAASNPEYGFGTEMHYDLLTIESKLAQAIVKDSVLLKADRIEPFPYFMELFLSSEHVLLEVASKVKQEWSHPINTAILTVLQGRIPDTNKALSLLQIIVSSVCKTGGSRDMTLVDYAKQWLSSDTLSFKGVQPEITNTPLRCIVTLYETLEDVILPIEVKNLKPAYCETPPVEIIDMFLKNLTSFGITLHIILFVLGRVVLRYIIGDRFTTEFPLRNLIKVLHVWPQFKYPGDISAIQSIFPEDLQVCHIQALFLAVRKKVDEQAASQTTTAASQMPKKAVANSVTTKKRRAMF
ncbi:E3 ubiquitin-protein ligase RNF213 [Pelomyxa schiedti]|nr:E3 ubiquitin-protein ligase RNF213 [Pelomyxa schiedti]